MPLGCVDGSENPKLTPSKECTECKLVKPLTEYHRQAVSKDGRLTKCKLCCRELRKKRPCRVCQEPATGTMCQSCSSKNAADAARDYYRCLMEDRYRANSDSYALARANRISKKFLTNSARLARRLTNSGPKRTKIEPGQRRRISERDAWTCQLCMAPTARVWDAHDELSPEIDHIVLWSQGGNNLDENLRLVHRGCNNLRFMWNLNHL